MGQSAVRRVSRGEGFSALQRAEIAEIRRRPATSIRRASVSVLFNEPKLLKFSTRWDGARGDLVSVLFNEPKLLKSVSSVSLSTPPEVSVLFNEPKLLKSVADAD